MKSFGTTKLLGLIFVGMVSLLALVNLSRQNTAAQVLPPTIPQVIFPDVAQTQISRITVESRLSGRKITLTKVPGDWTATDEKGASVQADLNQVTKMLQILPTLRYNRVMEGSDVKAFGLSDGGIFVVSFEAGVQYTMHIGDLNSALTYSYVQRDSEPRILQVPAVEVATLVRMVADQPGQSGTP
jgi:hypothetical protein